MRSIRSVLAGNGPEKRCRECKELLPMSSFHRRKEHKDGRYSLCRNCANRRRRARYKKRKANMRSAMEAFER